MAENGSVIAGYRREGAEKLAKVAKRFKYNPYVYGVNGSNERPVQKVSALVCDWDNGRLFVVGSDNDDVSIRYAFGVCNSN